MLLSALPAWAPDAAGIVRRPRVSSLAVLVGGWEMRAVVRAWARRHRLAAPAVTWELTYRALETARRTRHGRLAVSVPVLKNLLWSYDLARPLSFTGRRRKLARTFPALCPRAHESREVFLCRADEYFTAWEHALLQVGLASGAHRLNQSTEAVPLFIGYQVGGMTVAEIASAATLDDEAVRKRVSGSQPHWRPPACARPSASKSTLDLRSHSKVDTKTCFRSRTTPVRSPQTCA